MTLLIGTDEAGYGPNLGPLVIAATAWRVPGQLPNEDLYARLAPCVARHATDDRFAIADSKSLYSPTTGLGPLEQTVLTAVAAAAPGGAPVRRWRDIWPALVPRLDPHVLSEPWHAHHDEPLPIAAEPLWLEAAVPRWVTGMAQADVKLVAVQAEALFPAEFNLWVARHDSKGAVLSLRTLQLVANLLRELEQSDPLERQIVIQCDKHGGRNSYLALLQTVFPDYLPEVVREGRETSIYRWGSRARRIEIRFTAKGEHFLPTALASMNAKYLRELAMRALNSYWQSRVPTLRPTAGYPADAKRFRDEIASELRSLGIDANLLWRCR